ncbi:tRNA (guanine-N(1)-)-methyltransferase [Enhygromyxa salina]|uniref:tRNA (guanine-N(1)-)-methyltransferase n=1 Tax=Enhygromyxa salina TaxID=215803 RepID=A0A2S9XFY0_9BACT|nr:tRNA (guanosine(37)-N1)-methyltransferase TrmD [Enhygromyxa salina]PRP91762.1 tRNA (guanine-N(1)-)-methyltransferase [Enhygromyxa salina]
MEVVDDTLEFEVFTIFPAVIEAFVAAGIMARAIERGLVAVHSTDLREFTDDRHRTVDDAPFGGGAGMVIKPEPVAAALESATAARGPMHTILLTPSGPRFDQRAAERLAGEPRIALLCGRYEGIDDRIREHFVDECLSIGDFVLNGGEVAAAVIIEAVARLREGVLGNPESIEGESFAAGLGDDSWRPGTVLEHPHYTRPAEFRGHAVPPVLLGGDHGAVERWRRRSACLRTWALRPELRPRWQLPPKHPIYLAVSTQSVADDEAGQLTQVAADAGFELAAVGARRLPGAPLHMRDLKQLCRHLRKRHGRAPWLLGVGTVGPDEPERGPRLILDVLAFEAGEPPPPLIFWVGCSGLDDPAAAKRSPQAWLALDPGRPRGHDPRLALASALIDISQPQPARLPVAPLARAVGLALRAEGLLQP